jgi:hypothetical protein
MGETGIDVGVVGLAFAFAEELLYLDFKAIDAGWSLCEEARRFVNHQARAVVVEDFEHCE